MEYGKFPIRCEREDCYEALSCLILSLFLILAGIPCSAEDALYPIRVNGLWGYMDRAGRVVIAPEWDQAGPFDGTAAVVGRGASFNGRLYGMIRRDGSLAVPVMYPGIRDCGPYILFSDQFFMDYGEETGDGSLYYYIFTEKQRKT